MLLFTIINIVNFNKYPKSSTTALVLLLTHSKFIFHRTVNSTINQLIYTLRFINIYTSKALRLYLWINISRNVTNVALLQNLLGKKEDIIFYHVRWQGNVAFVHSVYIPIHGKLTPNRAKRHSIIAFVSLSPLFEWFNPLRSIFQSAHVESARYRQIRGLQRVPIVPTQWSSPNSEEKFSGIHFRSWITSKDRSWHAPGIVEFFTFVSIPKTT